MLEDCLHVNCIPEHDHIDDEPERAELIFLLFAIALPQFAPFTAENDARDTVPTFSPFELCKRAPADIFVVDEAQRMQGFVDAPEFGDLVNAMALTADGRRVVSVSYDNTLRLWDLKDGKELATFTLDGNVTACSVGGPDSQMIVVGDGFDRVHFLRFR